MGSETEEWIRFRAKSLPLSVSTLFNSTEDPSHLMDSLTFA